MANSLKNVTIPLTGSLNMNKNESLTDSSFSIFNKQNSPVFGGSISPLHYKLNGTDEAVYTYSGDKFYVKSGSLYKNDVALKDLSSEKAFKITNIEEDLDGLEVSSCNRLTPVSEFRVAKEMHKCYRGGGVCSLCGHITLTSP